MIDAGYSGFNVTVPHKQIIMDMLDRIDDNAQKIGAVNTVVIKDGVCEGRNTDAFGFIENLKEAVPRFKFKGTALVLGAGGAARAVVHALQQEGLRDIRIINRTLDRARDLGDAYEWSALPDLLRDAALIVNTTSLGMAGQPPLEIDLSPAPKTALVNDIVYTPLDTDLLKQAKSHGLQTVTGIGMLLHQARPAFQAWFGVLPSVDDELRQKVLA
jgi:shikimate dehydrogenase